jgi:hypothetical protein
MESLRPLSIPEKETSDKVEDGEPRRAWPRVGPDEGVTKPTESRSAPSGTVSEVAQDGTQPAAMDWPDDALLLSRESELTAD